MNDGLAPARITAAIYAALLLLPALWLAFYGASNGQFVLPIGSAGMITLAYFIWREKFWAMAAALVLSLVVAVYLGVFGAFWFYLVPAVFAALTFTYGAMAARKAS
jgi:hypothetical protein